MSELKPNPEFLKVDPAARKKWHDALVACKRPQARECMVDSNGGYCCLMVGHEALGGSDEQRNDQVPNWDSPFANAFCSNNPRILIGDLIGDRGTAAECNDTHRMPFQEIAKLVYPEAYQ